MSTPLMKQYAQVKAKYPGTILLFRMGDFFETFEEDAVTTAKVLGITLTKRGNGAAGDIPLAGFPHHALDTYLPKLLKAGHRVAVCEQLEDPKLARGIVKRGVVEVVSPGVAFSDKVLEQKQNNYLAAVALPSALATGDDTVGFAFIDVSTADFRLGEVPFRALPEQISSLAPAEILVQKRDREPLSELLSRSFSGLYTPLDDWVFNPDLAHELLTAQFKTKSLKGFGVEDLRHGIMAAGAIMHYLQETQQANLLHIRRVIPHRVDDHIVLDASTKRNLEITSSISGSGEGTLFSVLDRTTTPMGARLFKHWINEPLNSLPAITSRVEAVEELHHRRDKRSETAGTLSGFGDMERLATRICTGRANPRDLVAMRSCLARVRTLEQSLADATAAALVSLRGALNPLDHLAELIESGIEPDPPAALGEGGVIRRGFHPPLDELRELARSGKQWIADLQMRERERTGIPSLKVGFNNVFGYYIEVTNAHREKIPGDYTRKQTLTSAERFVTPELKEREEKILRAEERMLSLETELFNDIRMTIAAEAEAIQTDARSIAELDCYVSLATVAVDYGYIRPEVNSSTAIDITEGRHPVIERLLPPGESYTPNDVRLDTVGDQILIVTGPNMSGKSSYLRQLGLIVLLAQIGSFVPAKKAVVGIVDRIFTRVGASDNIASGESTFLVEMHEAAHIANGATKRSLVLLDEVGRGTSTFDGISIAWALTEYLHERVGARTLFATHYHELNELADLFPRIRNYKVDVREYNDTVLFLHKVTPGFADHSYGIQVARMAGLPDEVIDRAKAILANLEQSDLSIHDTGAGRNGKGGRVSGPQMQMTLFELKDDAVREELRGINLDTMTPLEALQRLAELKKKYGKP